METKDGAKKRVNIGLKVIRRPEARLQVNDIVASHLLDKTVCVNLKGDAMSVLCNVNIGLTDFKKST